MISFETVSPHLSMLSLKKKSSNRNGSLALGSTTISTSTTSTISTTISTTFTVAQKEGNFELIESSSVARHFAALMNTQNHFEELIRKQAQANNEVPTGKVKTHIIDLVYRMDGILSYLERKAEKYEGTYEATAANVEKMIDAIMAPARARATKKENEMAMA